MKHHVICGMILPTLFGHAAFAQTPFTARVYEEGTNKPVESTIEYEVQSGTWTSVKPTNKGVAAAPCPGAGNIRAIPRLWEYAASEEKPCGGDVPLPVERRDLSELIEKSGNMASGLSREEFAGEYASAVLAERDEINTTVREPEARLVESYLRAPEQLGVREREKAETLILNQTSNQFQRFDHDRNSMLSASELQAAMAPPR